MVRKQNYNGTNVLSADHFQTLKAYKKDETLCYRALVHKTWISRVHVRRTTYFWISDHELNLTFATSYKYSF